MFGINSGNKKDKFLGPKAMNRKQLLIQNLIFVSIAVMIILILGFIVISNLGFLVEQINLSLRVRPTMTEEKSFDLEGLEAIKSKLPMFSPEVSPIPTSTSTLEVVATTTPTVFPGTSTLPIIPE
jgi:hypothetical protein